ncbi:MAG: ATP-binding cassette domain-containing protein [candidate division Zixibacteria bacterium]|nr:ATP-binding cassette domain-containing protein [candidate division Zixibacteria bacterium]
MIEFEKVHFSHGHQKIFSNLSFVLERGKYVVISGPARSGKTTLIQLIIGQYEPDGGEIYVIGEAMSEVKSSPRRLREWRRKIGGVGGIYSLLADRTVLENVALSAEIAGYSPHAARKSALEACGKYRLGPVLSHYPSIISEVERRAALLARVEASHKNFIIVDGPTDGLDAKSARFINERLAALRLSGITILYLTTGEGPQSGPDTYLKIRGGALNI